MLTQIAWTASTACDNFVNQTLRASVYTEGLNAPGHRCQPQNGQLAWFMTSFFPIVQIVQGQIAYSSGPPWQFQVIPNQYFAPVESPFDPQGSAAFISAHAGMNAIAIGGGYVNYSNGNHGMRIQITYINGWPHCGLTQDAPAGSTTLQVDDVTGFVGCMASMPSISSREFVTVESISANTPGQLTPSGPGTLTLQSPTQFAHTAGELVSTMPETIMEAAVWFAVSQSLARASSIVGAPPQQGRQVASAGVAMDRYVKRAQELLGPYRRVI